MASPVLVTYCMPNRRKLVRVGITATKKVGGAVQRNRAKRLVRAAFRELAPGLPAGWDFVFVCRTRTASSRMPQVLESMTRQIGALTRPGPGAGKGPAKK